MKLRRAVITEPAPRRIAIIGCGGAGKSTLAVKMGDMLRIPVFHLDRLFWQPRWQALDSDAFIRLQGEILCREQWIVDGNYGATMEMRLIAADTVVFLDYPVLTCVVGAVFRYLRYAGRTRPDMNEGNPERLNREFIGWILRYRRTRRPGILRRLVELSGSKRVVILQNRGDAFHWLESLGNETIRTDL